MPMEKITIKSVQRFCDLQQRLHGSTVIPAQIWSFSGKSVDVRFRPVDLEIFYDFKGSADEDGSYIQGSWETTIPAVCCRCRDEIDLPMNAFYSKIYLKDGNVNTLNFEHDAIECELFNFDILPWLLSEVILQVPISPKHTHCQMESTAPPLERMNKIVLKNQKFLKESSINHNEQLKDIYHGCTKK